MEYRVVILGAGHVGSHVAMALASGGVCGEIVLVDRVPGKAQAQADDVADSLSWMRRTPVVRAGDYADCADADVTVCAIGKPRAPGQTRLDLMADSLAMIRDLAGSLRPYPLRGLMISITNPCDVIAARLRDELGMPRFRCFGTGTLLDTARLKRILSEQTGAPRDTVSAMVLGEHGDSSSIPYSCLSIGGKPAASLPGFDAADALRRTHQTGMDIIEGKGSTEFGIGHATAALIGAILSDAGETLPLSTRLDGEYGLTGVTCGVPCVVGRHGIERIVELPLTDAERAAFMASVRILKAYENVD